MYFCQFSCSSEHLVFLIDNAVMLAKFECNALKHVNSADVPLSNKKRKKKTNNQYAIRSGVIFYLVFGFKFPFNTLQNVICDTKYIKTKMVRIYRL